MENSPEEIDHQKRIAAYVWIGLSCSVASGYTTLEDADALYQEWFADIPHEIIKSPR